MLNMNYFYLFFAMTAVGTILTISASSWFSIWLGLEINLMSIIPILMAKNSFLSSDSSIKYFIVQAVSSIVVISSASLHMKKFFMYPESIMSKTIILALCIKAAIAPFHLWLIQIINNSEWIQIIIILTWQKIAPLWVMSSLNSHLFSTQMIILSALTGSLGGLLTNKVKKILTFSSVVHSSWMLAIVFLNKMIWILYTAVYFFLMANLTYFASELKISSVNKIKTLSISNTILINFTVSVLSIAGLPPLLGFFPKLIVIQAFILNWLNPLIIFSLILGTLMALMFYLKMIIGISLKPNSILVKTSSLNKLFTKFMLINIVGATVFLLMIFN